MNLDNLYWIPVDGKKPYFPPEYATLGSNGIDLKAAEEAIISHDTVTCVDTNIAMIIPSGYVGQLHCRSGLFVKKHVVVQSSYFDPLFKGIIDSDYRGNIKVPLRLLGPSSENPTPLYIVKPGDSIAQLVILPSPRFTLQKIQTASNIDDGYKNFIKKFTSERGVNGFGSTDTKN